MPLDLKEAETAAYLDPSQENLAVYVKLLEEALEDAGDQSVEIERLEGELEAAPSPDELADVENDRDELASQFEALRAEAQNVVDNWETGDLAAAVQDLAKVLQ